MLARAPVLGQPRDEEAHHLVARDERRDERGAHRGGSPERAGEHRRERAAAGLRALQLAAQLGQRDDVGPVRRARRGGAHAQPVAARLEQVDAQRLGAEQAERLLDRHREQVVDRLGARDVPAELRELLELAQRAPRALVQARVLDRVGHERGDVQQEGGVLRAEHARGLGVQRDHADHALALGDQRHRHERLVLLLLELGEVLDARVGERLLRDEDRLPVLQHPAGDALARRHRDAAAEMRVALRGGAQHDAPPAVLAQEDVGRVRDDGVVDEPHDRAQHLLEIERRVDGVDDLVEDAELVLLRRTRAVGCGYGCAQRSHEWTLARVSRPGVRAGCTPSGRAAVGVSSHPRAGCAPRPHLASTVAIRDVLRGTSEIRRTLVATDLERFVSAPGRDELVKNVREQIDAAGVTYIYYQFISVTGRIMGKGVPAAHWESMARKGFQLVYGATANLFVDRHGEYIGYGPEAAELVGLPEPETFQVLPWDTKVARVWCTCFRGREDLEDGGSYLTADCRNNLKLIQAEFTERTGMHLRAGLEPEMIWLKANEDGTPTFEGMSKPYCYHIDQFSQFQPIIHKVIEYANAMGLDMIQGDHEDAPGQLELNFNFDVAEKTADNLSTYRQVCKQVGREMQAFPCFMPKPFMGVSANGCHHNISLWEGDDNKFMPAEGEDQRMPGQIGKWAIGGILEHLGALTAITRLDGQLLPPAVGHGLLGAGLRGLGLPEPHDRAARVGARPLRVPLGRLRRQPLPLAGRADQGHGRRHPAQARSGPARGAQHLPGHRGRQGRQEDPDDLRRRARRARRGRGRQERPSGRDVQGLPALQARRMGALLRDRERLGPRGIPRRPALTSN